MNRQYLRQAKIKREKLIEICQNILTHCKSHEHFFDRFILDPKKIGNTKQEWRKHEDHNIQSKQLNVQNAIHKLKTEIKLKNSRRQFNNPKSNESSSINNTQRNLINNIKNDRLLNMRSSVKVNNQQSTQYQSKKKNIVNEYHDFELQRFQNNILRQNQIFLRSKIRELQKLIREKYQSRSSVQESELYKKELDLLLNKYRHKNASQSNQYVQQEISYLREKFLDHYEKCQSSN